MHDKLQNFIYIFPVLILSVALHEFAHCWTTDRLGDDTPRLLGRLTLNPLAHLNPLGTVMMVVSAFTGFWVRLGEVVTFRSGEFSPSRTRSDVVGNCRSALQCAADAGLGLDNGLLLAQYSTLIRTGKSS